MGRLTPAPQGCSETSLSMVPGPQRTDGEPHRDHERAAQPVQEVCILCFIPHQTARLQTFLIGPLTQTQEPDETRPCGFHSRAAAPLQVPWRPPDRRRVSEAPGQESPLIQGLLSPACDALCSPASPALRGHPVTELWPRAARLTDQTSAWRSRPLPSPYSMRPWTGQKPPLAQDRSQKGPVLQEAQAGSPPPLQHPDLCMGRPQRSLSPTRARRGDQTHLGRTVSREAADRPGGGPGSPQAVRSYLQLSQTSESWGPAQDPRTCQGPLLSPDDRSPRSLCCPAPRSHAGDGRIRPFSFPAKGVCSASSVHALPVTSFPTAA